MAIEAHPLSLRRTGVSTAIPSLNSSVLPIALVQRAYRSSATAPFVFACCACTTPAQCARTNRVRVSLCVWPSSLTPVALALSNSLIVAFYFTFERALSRAGCSKRVHMLCLKMGIKKQTVSSPPRTLVVYVSLARIG